MPSAHRRWVISTAMVLTLMAATGGATASSSLSQQAGALGESEAPTLISPLLSEPYCQEVHLESGTDCLGHFHSLTDNTVIATASVCAGAFTEGLELHGSYECNNIGANEAEHVYSGENLLYPVAHNHSSTGNTVFGEESY